MKRRGPKLARWFAGVYLAWSLLVFLGSLGSESHSWWPIFLYPIIWPLSFFFESLDHVRTEAGYAIFYIVVGTVWVWCVGRLLSMFVTRLFPLPDELAAEGAGSPRK